MRVCLVSTYPPRRCGIGTYTQALATALADLPDTEVRVLAETGALDGTDGKVRVEPTYSREGPWVDAVLSRAAAHHADVVHVQHSPDTLGLDARMPELCRRLRERGIASVVTLHTVHGWLSALIERRFGTRAFARSLGEAASAVVVHQRGGTTTMLQKWVGAPRVEVIPHGSARVAALDPLECRRALGIPEAAPLLVTVGFIHPQKNLHVLIAALPEVRRRVGDVRLVLAGSVQNPTWVNRKYVEYLRARIRRLRLESVAELREEFVSDEDMARLFQGADLALLPYWQWYGSASGVVHLALAHKTPMLCSMSPKFAEVAEALGEGARVPTHSPARWADRISELLLHPEQLAAIRASLAEALESTAWPAVAARTRDLYQRLLLAAVPTAAAP